MIVRKIFESFVGGSSFMINLILIIIMIVEGRSIFKVCDPFYFQNVL